MVGRVLFDVCVSWSWPVLLGSAKDAPLHTRWAVDVAVVTTRSDRATKRFFMGLRTARMEGTTIPASEVARFSMPGVHRLLTVALTAPCLFVPAAAAQGPLTGLPAGFDSVVVVRDVLPGVEAALASEVLQAPLVREQLEAVGVELGAIRAALAVFSRHVPVEIVVAAPPRAIAAGAHLWGAVLALLLRTEDGDDADARARLKAHIAALADIDVVGHVRARDADTAEQWFDALTDALDALPVDDGLRVAISGATIDLTFEPLRWRRGQALTRFSLPATLADDWPLRWTMQLRHEGRRLSFRLGKACEGQLDPALLGDLWRDASEQLFFGRLNAAAAITVMDDVFDFVDEREGLLEDVLERDPRLSLMFESLSVRLASLDPVSAYALNLLEGGVELLDHTEFAEGGEVEVLPPGGVLGYVDPAQAALFASGAELDSLIHALLEAARDEFVERAARDELAARKTPATRALAFLDEELMPFREFFAGEASVCFASGTLLVLDGASDISSIEVTTPSGPVTGKLEDVRVPAFAIVGRLAEGEDPWRFAQACSASALVALGPAPEPLQLADVDLGLGVPTRTIPWTAWARGGRGFRLVGDLQPHWFVHAGALAFSTSPALSRRMLAQHGSTDTAPPAGVAGWWRCSGETLARAIEQVATAVVAAAAPSLSGVRAALGVELDAAAAEATRQGCDVAAAIARRIGRIEMRQRLEDRSYSDRLTLTWAR